MERRTGEEKLLRDIQKIQKINERGGLQRKSRVNGVVDSKIKQLTSRRELLAEKQGRCVWDAVRRGKHPNTSNCTALGGKRGE